MRLTTHRGPALALLVLLAPLTGCSALQSAFARPEVTYEDTDFVLADFEKMRLDVHLSVENPNSVGVRLEGYDAEVTVDGLTLVDGAVTEPLDLGPGATTRLTVPATLRWEQLADRLGRGIPADLPFRARGTARVKTPIGPTGIPFDVEGRVPVVVPPVVVPTGARIASRSFTAVEVAIDIAIRNPNARPIGFLELRQRVTLAGEPVSEAGAPPFSVGPGETETRTILVRLSLSDVGAGLLRLITGDGAVAVGVDGRALIDTGLGECPLEFRSTRDLPFGT